MDCWCLSDQPRLTGIQKLLLSQSKTNDVYPCKPHLWSCLHRWVESGAEMPNYVLISLCSRFFLSENPMAKTTREKFLWLPVCFALHQDPSENCKKVSMAHWLKTLTFDPIRPREDLWSRDGTWDQIKLLLKCTDVYPNRILLSKLT